MEIGKYYKLEFVFLFCFVFPRELLYQPQTHTRGALRGLELEETTG